MIKKNILFISALLVLASGCKKDWLDVNDDPSHPLVVSEETLLPRAEQYLAFSLGFSRGSEEVGLSEVLAVYTHQMTLREEPDQYGATGSEFNLSGAWDSFYEYALPDLDGIITQGTKKGNMKYVGVAKILKAYGFSQFTDTFGDIPFSQANKFSEGILYSKFDKPEDVYPELIKMLDEAVLNLRSKALNTNTPGDNDIIYNGSTDKWIKAANTIKLKLYNQIRLKTDVKTQVAAILSKPDSLIGKTDEGFMFNFGPGITPDDRNPAFNDYVATQKSRYVSPWFYEIMQGYNSSILTNIRDPRIPYYWYNQLGEDDATAFKTEYRDGSFVSIYFGSTGVNRDWSSDSYMTVFGIYPAGGRYDEGDSEAVDNTSGTGAAPFRFLTYADRLFIEAELIHAGVISGDEKEKFTQALQESFKQVDFVVAKAKLASQTIPSLSGSAAVNKYVKDVTDLFTSASIVKKLELIITEKWISSFGNSTDQYTDYRRTGFPVLFNPNNPVHAPGGKAQPPLGGNPTIDGDQEAVPVQLTRAYPLSLPWPQEELETNANAPEQKQPSSYRVFWDID